MLYGLTCHHIIYYVFHIRRICFIDYVLQTKTLYCNSILCQNIMSSAFCNIHLMVHQGDWPGGWSNYRNELRKLGQVTREGGGGGGEGQVWPAREERGWGMRGRRVIIMKCGPLELFFLLMYHILHIIYYAHRPRPCLLRGGFGRGRGNPCMDLTPK